MMRMMKKPPPAIYKLMKIPAITYPSLLSALFISFLAPGVAQAQTIDVTFENEPAPLFGESNVLPGDSVSRSFTVKNTGTDDRTAYVRTINDADTNGLAGALRPYLSAQIR